MVEKQKKQRKRVPISCLICKKRKVKCDKGKPTCGGCIRNGVAHLCQYMEPHWSKGEDKPPVALESSEFIQLKKQQEKIITSQRQEIDDLKRQLMSLSSHPNTIANGNGVGVVSNASNGLGTTSIPTPPDVSINYKAITILNKLRPLSVASRDLFQVYGQSNYRIIQVNNKKYYVDKYSWMSLIKLDSKLINLWLKMIKFQQYYLAYKRYQNGMGKDISQQNGNHLTHGHGYGPGSNGSFNGLGVSFNRNSNTTNGSSQLKCPVSHSPNKNSSLTSSSDLKCPVIDTSQLIDPNSIVPSKIASPVPTPVIKNGVTTSILLSSNIQIDDDINVRISRTMLNLKSSWESMISLNQKQRINDKQLHFLMEFYFNNNKIINFDSKNVLSFYKSEITGIIIKKGDTVMFDCTSFMSQEKDESLLQDLLVKGSYLCMLAIIVDETLSYLKHFSIIQPKNSTSIQFISLFSPEIINYSRPITNIYSILKDFLINFKNSSNNAPIGPFLPFIVVVIAWIKQQMLHYNKLDFPNDYKYNFTEIVTSYLQLILNENSTIEIWKDPYSIKFKSSSVKSDDDLAIHLSFVWVELVRLTNLMTFNLISLLKNSELLDGLIRQLYIKIEEADYSKVHINYLEELNVKESKFQDLIVFFKTHYLISRINSAINHGTMNLGEPKLTIEILEDLINQSIQTIDRIDNLQQPIKRFESLCILNYLNCYMSHIIMLQGEDSNDQEIIASVIPDFFVRFADFIKYLKDKVQKESNTHLSQYILSIITEFLTKSVQILTGLILRISTDESTKPQDSLINNQIKQFKTIKQAPYTGMTLANLVRKNMVKSVDESLLLLSKSSYIDQDKIQKLSNRWVDYCTITSKVNYSEVHQHVPELVGKFFSTGSTGRSPAKRKKTASHPSISNLDSGEFRRCPISHITTAMDDNPETPRIQGVLAHQSLEVKEDRKRKCPYIDSGSNYRKSGFNSNPVESNIRGGGFNGNNVVSSISSQSQLNANSQPQVANTQSTDSFNRRIKVENDLQLDTTMPPPQASLELNLDSLPVPTYDFNSLSDLNFDIFQQDGFSTDVNFTYENIFGDASFEFY